MSKTINILRNLQIKQKISGCPEFFFLPYSDHSVLTIIGCVYHRVSNYKRRFETRIQTCTYERVYMMPCLSHRLEHESIVCPLFIKPEGKYKSRKYTRFKTGCVYRGQSKRGSGSNAYQNILFLAFQNGEAKRVSKRPCVYRGLPIY